MGFFNISKELTIDRRSFLFLFYVILIRQAWRTVIMTCVMKLQDVGTYFLGATVSQEE